MALADRTCVPCRGGTPPLDEAAIATLLAELDGWEVWRVSAEGAPPKAPVHGALRKTYALKNFAEALALVNRIGAMAEEQNHHPDLTLSWGRVGVEIWTHTVGGLTESDFIFAAKCDRLAAEQAAAAGGA